MYPIQSNSFVGIATNESMVNRKNIYGNAQGDITLTFSPYTGVLNEAVGTGDGTITDFQLAGHDVIVASDTIYVNGTASTRDVDYTIDYTIGSISFAVAPLSGDVITADYNGFVDIVKTMTLDIGTTIEVRNVAMITSVASISIT